SSSHSFCSSSPARVPALNYVQEKAARPCVESPSENQAAAGLAWPRFHPVSPDDSFNEYKQEHRTRSTQAATTARAPVRVFMLSKLGLRAWRRLEPRYRDRSLLRRLGAHQPERNAAPHRRVS